MFRLNRTPPRLLIGPLSILPKNKSMAFAPRIIYCRFTLRFPKQRFKLNPNSAEKGPTHGILPAAVKNIGFPGMHSTGLSQKIFSHEFLAAALCDDPVLDEVRLIAQGLGTAHVVGDSYHCIA